MALGQDKREDSPFQSTVRAVQGAIEGGQNMFRDVADATFEGVDNFLGVDRGGTNTGTVTQRIGEAFRGAQDNTRDAVSNMRFASDNVADQATQTDVMNYIRSVDKDGNVINRPGFTNQAVSNSNTKRLAELAGINTMPTNALLDLMLPGSAEAIASAQGGAPAPTQSRLMLPAGTGNDRIVNGQFIPGQRQSPIEAMMERALDLRKGAEGERDLLTRASQVGQANMIRDFARIMAGENVGASRDATSRANVQDQISAMAPYREALALQAMAGAQATVTPKPVSFDNDLFTAMMSMDFGEGNEGLGENLALNYLKRHLATTSGAPDKQKYANGGLVKSSLGSAAIDMPQVAELQAYRQYADGARSMGLTVVPFPDFLGMQQGGAAYAGASDGVMKFANGGMVPDASGKLVVDSDPNAPTDSIPAVIDGQQPAALDSGEFVVPQDVVMFYGTDKLNKMIEKARNPDGNSTGQAGSAGVSAIAAAAGS